MPSRSSALALVAGFVFTVVIAARPAAQGQAAAIADKAPPRAATLETHMGEHFSRIREVQEAIIRGDLEMAKPPARWIAEHPEAGMPANTVGSVAAMKAAANDVVNASDLSAAASGAALLLVVCGDCHTAAGVRPKMPSEGAIAAVTGPKAHMLEHQHAINLLYRGLAAPSDAEWKKGAQALRESPLGAKEIPEAVEVITAETQVHELAARALEATNQSVKADLYGQLIGACASCHGLHGRVWGPGAPKAN
jgi:mono/diheme cytochrome c family protein